MAAKKKTVMKKATRKKAEAKPRANWGANENPRHCRACKSTNSRVSDTKPFQHPARVVRYRVCGDCGQKYSTLEVEHI